MERSGFLSRMRLLDRLLVGGACMMKHPVHKKRPCRCCRRWFRPNPRVGDRQKTCGENECQREWNRRLCRARRAREPYREREDRLRDRLQDVGGSRAGELPDRALNQNAARHAIGPEPLVVIEEYCRVVLERARHEFGPQPFATKRESHRLPRLGARHEIGTSRAPS